MSAPSENTCPACGLPLDTGAWGGLCPRCMLGAGLATEAQPGPHPEGQTGGHSTLPVRCPHCSHLEDVPTTSSLTDVQCSACGNTFSLVPTEDLGTVGHFQVVEKLGTGGFGTVWKARDTKLDRWVALKVPLRRHLEAQQAEKFMREARAAAQLRHPNIVSVHEVGRDQDLIYIASDLIEGTSLADRLRAGPLGFRESAQLCLKIADALDHAHTAGVVHRDLKPQNILVDGHGEPHLTDFGLARRDAGEVTVTLDGQVLGTPAYMSPEQARGQGHHADRRSDIYSLGVILFQLLTGELPFRGSSRMLIHQVLNDEPPSPRKLNSQVPRDLETICLKCLEKDPDRRYTSARELKEEFERQLRGEPIRSRPISPVARLGRWCRRRPALAALAAAVLALAAVSTTVAARLWIESNAKENERYRAGIRLAAAHIQEGNIDLALESLLQAPPRFRHWEWGYLVAQCHREVLSLDHARDPTLREGLQYATLPWAVAFDRSGQRIAAWNGSGELCLWELPTGRPLLRIRHPAHWETGLILTPDWSRVVYVPSSNVFAVAVVAPDDPKNPRLLTGHTNRIRRIALSPDGAWVAAVATDDTLRIWNLVAPMPTVEVAPFAGIDRLQFTPDSRRLVAANHDHLEVYDVRTGSRLQRADHHREHTTRLFSSPEANRWVTTDLSNRFRLWAPDGTGQDLGEWRGESGALASVSFSPDGRRLAHGGDYGTAAVRDGVTGRLEMSLPGQVYQTTFSPDGSHLATAGGSPTIQVWDLAARREVVTLKGHTEPIHHFAFSPDGYLLASISWMGTVKVWSTRLGREQFDGSSFVNYVAQTRDGKRIAFEDFSTGWIRICDTETGAVVANLKRDGRPPRMCSFSPDGRVLAVSGVAGETALWETETGRLLRVLRGHSNFVPWVQFSPDGRQLVTGSMDGTAKVWNADTGALLHTLPGSDAGNGGNWAGFSPDGRLLVSAVNRTVWVYDAATLRRRHVVEGHETWGITGTFSPDGRIMATGGRDRTVRFWDAETGRPLGVWKVRGVCCSIAYSPDGRRIVLRAVQADSSLSDPPTTEIWDVEAGQPLLIFRGHTELADSGAFSPDGRRVIADWWDHAIRQWESFPWRETEYPGTSTDPIPTRMRQFADRYWRDRLAAEQRGRSAGPPLTMRLARDRSLIQPRDPGTPDRLLDLSPFFTGPVQELSQFTDEFLEAHDLRRMPRGRLRLGGVEFDVRGIIQLKCTEDRGPAYALTWEDIPAAVTGIPVRQRARRTHLLLGTHRPAPDGTVIGSLTLHYANGSRHDHDILYGRHVRDLPSNGDPLTATDLARIAWEDEDPLARPGPYKTRLRVFQASWENPFPDQEIVSLDFSSTLSSSAPFVIAITLE